MTVPILITCALTAFQGTVTLGGLLTSGNSDIQQLDSGLELAGQPTSVLETGLALTASYGSQDDAVYLEKYLSEGNLRYSLSERNYAASRAYWTRDEFSGISHEYGGTLGLGREMISFEVFNLSLEAGGGYLSRENTAEEELETATWYSGLAAEWMATEEWTVAGTTRITGDFEDSENYYLGSLLEATSAITGSLSFSTGFQLEHYNVPPVEGNERTDTSLRVQLRYDI